MSFLWGSGQSEQQHGTESIPYFLYIQMEYCASTLTGPMITRRGAGKIPLTKKKKKRRRKMSMRKRLPGREGGREGEREREREREKGERRKGGEKERRR